MNTRFIYFYDNFLCQGSISDDKDIITSIQCAVPSGVPFLVISTEDLLHDDVFFDCGYVDFSDPDGYGYGPTAYSQLIEYKLQNNISDDLIQEEINNTSKDRSVKLNMTFARNVWLNKLRNDRKPLFELLDTKYLRALEINNQNEISKIIEKKQLLRDITADPRIELSQNIEDLKKITIPLDFIEN